MSVVVGMLGAVGTATGGTVRRHSAVLAGIVSGGVASLVPAARLVVSSLG